MPEIIHDSEGLRIKRNDKNKFVVCSLYYYADPAKRKPEWEQTVKAGMTQSQWEKEYLINYTAQFGERVFPEILEKRELIVIPDQDQWDGPMWGGFDYGQRNPSSFHVYTYQNGAFIAIWELYKPCISVPEFSEEMKNCPYYHRLKYIACDPSMMAPRRTHNAAGEAASITSLFVKEGINKFIAGNNDQSTWLAIMRKHWEQEDPTFKITESCRNMIKEFERATFEDYTTDKARQLANFKEGIVDKDNHAQDDCKYFFNSQPVVRPGMKTKGNNTLVDKWYGWGEARGRRHNVPETYAPAYAGSQLHPRRKEFQDDTYGWKLK